MAAEKSDNATTAELEIKLSDEALSSITSFEDALAVLAETYGEDSIAVASEVLGDGFALLENKAQLIGITMVLVSWSFHIGDHGEYVIARIVTADNRKVVITDGSAGICRQLSLYSANTGKKNGLVVKNGFRQSDYVYTDDQGTEKPATTFYLDVSA